MRTPEKTKPRLLFTQEVSQPSGRRVPNHSHNPIQLHESHYTRESASSRNLIEKSVKKARLKQYIAGRRFPAKKFSKARESQEQQSQKRTPTSQKASFHPDFRRKTRTLFAGRQKSKHSLGTNGSNKDLKFSSSSDFLLRKKLSIKESSVPENKSCASPRILPVRQRRYTIYRGVRRKLRKAFGVRLLRLL